MGGVDKFFEVFRSIVLIVSCEEVVDLVVEVGVVGMFYDCYELNDIVV